MIRTAALIAGSALVVLAFGAATHVADTREGLIAEVVTLLASVTGIGLLIYGLTSGRRNAATMPAASRPRPGRRPRTTSDLLLGAGGVVVAAVLVTGLAISGGVLQAVFGLALLLPMIAGSVYLCVRFLRASP